MITREQIDIVLDHPVHDARGDKIGDARHVFFDDVTGEPEWVSVRTGLFGTSESFVPIHDAALVEDHLEVPFAKDQVKDAPNVDVDAGGHLSEQEEQRLYQYYGIDWDASWQDPDSGTGRATGTTGTTGTVGTVGTGDDAMTRSEEEMHVGVERHEAGRARLRKYVVTEEQQYTVPVRHEEVRVEREPITDANRDRAMTGPDITEAEHDVTLYEEQPVVETRAVPKERVRLTTEEVTEEETVTGEVRKERIESEGTDEHGDRRRRP
ncbi:YsnF/AvaK domain-containing protein [Streptomyces iakyrus]|uniref:YsnF/AvaK domain-containing protein n=1 Tax=Streptomyces iakyrus TaxID=68219 RepID=UPI0005273CCC|nr:YsnF/AvaK domain-containing protein [Streptomyces iakyrus]